MSRSTNTVKPKKRLEPGKIYGSGADKHVDQEEWLRLTQYSVDHFPEPAIWTDMKARFLYVNDAACAMLGYTRDELLTMSVPDIDPYYPLDKYAVFVEKIKRCGYLTVESTHVTRAGRIVPVELSTHYLEFGGKEYIISFSRDISDRKQAEADLRVSEAKYRSLVEEINDMVWDFDTNTTLTYVSPQTVDILGYRPEEVIGKKPFDFIYPEDIPMVKGIITQAINNHRPFKLLDYRVLRKDGRIIYIETNGQPIIDSGGTLTGFRGINRDVTDRIEAEEALRKNEQFLSRIFDSFQDGISILDKDLNIVRVNRALEDWYHYMNPLKGKKCYRAYHGRSAPCEVCPSLRAMRLKTMQSDIVPFHGEHGELKGWLEIYSFPLLDDEGNITGVIEHVRDITRRKQAEDALQEAKSRAELYLDLMSHDINNMNQIGIGFLELVLGSPRVEQSTRELLEKSLESLESSSRLIDNVQKLQKASSGCLHLEEVDVGQVVEQVKAYYTRTMGEGHIDYAPPACCKVMANELLYDVISNLVGNAIKHSTGKEGPEVSIKVSKATEAGKTYCTVAVEDKGPGIPDELKGKIFDRLHRGSTKVGGKGLGLYLVKSLVRSYGGRTLVEDRVPGDHTGGARFVVMLPARD